MKSVLLCFTILLWSVSSIAYQKTPAQMQIESYSKDPYLAEVLAETKRPYTLAAIAKRESGFRYYVYGDGGDSFGLYQYQEKHWGKGGKTVEEQTRKAEEIFESLVQECGYSKAKERWNGSGRKARIYKANLDKTIKEIQRI